MKFLKRAQRPHFRVSPEGAVKLSRGLAGDERMRTHRLRESSTGGTREKTLLERKTANNSRVCAGHARIADVTTGHT